jgi:hypothetical protein
MLTVGRYGKSFAASKANSPLSLLSDMGILHYVSFGVLEQMELQNLFGRESAARTFL